MNQSDPLDARVAQCLGDLSGPDGLRRQNKDAALAFDCLMHGCYESVPASFARCL
jgi:hypothetical protein